MPPSKNNSWDICLNRFRFTQILNLNLPEPDLDQVKPLKANVPSLYYL